MKQFLKKHLRWEFQRLYIRSKENFGNAFSTLFEDLADVLKELFVQIPKDIKHFIQNLWTYKGLLWRDRHWDHAFILRMLQMKIRLTRECIAKNDRHLESKKYVKEMQVAENLIQTVLDDSYAESLYEAHDAKWGPPKMVFVDVPGTNTSSYRTLRAKAYTFEQQALERKEYHAIMSKRIKLEQKTWNKLWTLLDKNMRNWWD